MLRLSAHIVAETALWRVTSQVTGHKLIVLSEDDANVPSLSLACL